MASPTVKLEQLREIFRNPPSQYSPVPIWWWSGESLDPARLRWQLEQLAAGGIYNVVILNLAPTGPLYGSDPDHPPFRSEDWWDLFRQVCRDARDVGVSLWFYDQIGFSGANLQGDLVRATPSFAGQQLARITQETREPVQLRCPAGGEALAASALPLTDDGKPAGAPIPLALRDGEVRWEGAGLHRVMLFYALPRGFDYFQVEACQALFAQVHGEFDRRLGEFFGSPIVGSFQDELPSLPAWGTTFAREFQQRRGYDLREHLIHLWEDLGPESRQIRAAYHQVRADLGEAAFFRPLFDWHERRGLICGFDQQGPARAGNPIEATQFYADYPRTQRWFEAPGSDHHGEAKIHSSLAHLYDRSRVWIEAFHSSGWGGTLEETFDWLVPWLRAGATLYDPHAVYYSTHGGWWEWAPPSTCWRQPYWRHYREFSTATSRLCGVLSQGSHVCDIGIVYPTATIQANLTVDGPAPAAQAAHEAYLSLVGRMFWQAMKPGILDNDQRDFDVLDDASLQRAEIKDGALRIGNEEYRAILLPAMTTIAATTARVLCRFVEAGGQLIAVGTIPEEVTGADDPAPARALGALFTSGRARLVETPEAVPAALRDVPRRVAAPVPTLLRQVDGATLLFVPAMSPMVTRHRREGDWRDIDYDFDPARAPRSVEVTVTGVSGDPDLWEISTGQRRRLTARSTGDAVTVAIPFDDAPAALLVWEPADAARRPAVTSGSHLLQAARPVDLGSSWQMQLIPTLDNRWGDFAWPPSPGPLPVQCWAAQYRREQPGEDGIALGWMRASAPDGAWEEVHATFGVQGWWLGPRDPGSLPTPHQGQITAGASDPLMVAGWQPSVYSLQRGIRRDQLHRSTLGPKGHVLEEFLDFGTVAAGQGIRYRTSFSAEQAATVTLAIGAPAAKTAWLNGQSVGEGGPGYLWLQPVKIAAGWNILEFQLVAEETENLRAYFALVEDAEAFRRPEWLGPGDGTSAGSLVRFRRTFELRARAGKGRVQLAADTPARLLINDQEAGRQGGFDPYDHRRVSRVQPYDVTELLRVGRNSIVVEALDLGQPCAALIDALITDANGERLSLVSDDQWECTRDQAPVPVVPRRQQWLDPAWSHLWRRPHPLSASAWLEEAADPTKVMPLRPDPTAGSERIEWLRFPIPPGAKRIDLPLSGTVDAFVDGEPVALDHGRVHLDSGPTAARTCAVRVIGATGGTGGALLHGPITFEVGVGEVGLGDWAAAGLTAYSGGVAYQQTISVEHRPGEEAWLDLGRVRGTAEVWVNGTRVGTRVWSPYQFKVTAALREGENLLRIEVFNTLAPYLAAVSPTHYVFPGQTVSGLLGPVRLVYRPTSDRPANG